MQQMWATVLVGAVNVVTTIIAIFVVDKLGRRPVLYVGLCITTISMGVLGTLFHLGIHSHTMQLLAVASILTFIFGFAVSLGPIMWIICAEIYPLKGRDAGVSVSTANWFFNAIIGLSFLSVLHHFGSATTFWLFMVFGFLSLIFTYFFVPETKNVSLEKIEHNLIAGKRLKQLGQ